jgi:uncharacterized protein
MTHPVIVRRRRERAEQIARAAEWAEGLAARLPVQVVVVVGSVARGDFNKWSDLDVLVVADALPDDPLERLALLDADAPPGLQPVGWTPEELGHRRARRDPLAVEADTLGVVVLGELP